MKLTKYEWWRPAGLETLCWIVVGLFGMMPMRTAMAQGMGTTTVQGTVYLASGQPGAGTLVVSWPAFTTATGQAVAADQMTVTIPSDGFVSVNLAPNVGALPAGQYYTAIFYMSDGTASTQYWQVPAAAQASLAQIQTQVMPAAQAVQAVSKAYVDQSVSELTQSLLTASGGNLSGPLYLNADPTQPLQGATKHYVDTQVSTAVPLAGGNMTGALGTPEVNGVEAPTAGSAQTTLQAAMNAAGSTGAMEIPPTYAGTDTFTNPNGVVVKDLRTSVAQQAERSVKEFGAVCDGVTDDTSALQAALNYANTHGVALTIPEGTCKTRTLNWHGESIGGMGKQVSALMGFPGQDVLATATDSPNLMQYTRLHDLTIYVDQSVDVSCSSAEGRAAAGSCQVGRPMEANSIFAAGGNGLTGTMGKGAAWAVGNCAIAMPAATGAGGNGLRVAEIENMEIATTGTDPMATHYPGAHSTHTCGMYLAQWPQWSEFRNIDIRGLNTGIAIPTLPVATRAGLNADSNRWQNVSIQATHAFTAAAGSNNVLDNMVAMAGNSAATGETPTGLVLDFPGTQQGWTVRNAVVMPFWNAIEPTLTVTAAGGAVTAVTVGTEQGLGWDPYGTSVPVSFSGSCTAQANATVNSNGSIGTVSMTQGGVGCSATTTASVKAAGTWDTAAPVNLISGEEMTFFAGSLLKGNGGYTVWNAASAQSYGTQLNGGGGRLPGGGSYPALVANSSLGSALEADQFSGADFGAKLQECVNAVNAGNGGTCDARNFTGNLSMGSNLTISTGNTTVLLPCATITTANQIVVTAGTRNVALRGCALRGGSAASGSQGGTAFAYSGSGAMVQVGDPTYAMDTSGFHLDNVVINTTAATSANSEGIIAYRTQELDLESLYLLGNGNQTGITMDGTGNYTGGTFLDDQIDGFQVAVNAIGHQVANSATTDWMNASAFVRLHIDCPTSGGNPASGTIGINLQQGDGNTFTGGDVEGCSTALHLGTNAQNNTIVGLRNENSTSQVVADVGSSYNNWMTGGTMFTGQLTDNGTRNSFLDSFHRSFNGLNGDWYGSQKDATVTNHYRLGIGTGNERGLMDEYQTDYGYRWTTGLSDATGGEQYYQILDQLNNVYRFQIGQYNNGQSNTNNQTVINAAGTGAVVLNGSNNAGTGGVVIGSGGMSSATVATINNAGNAQLNGTLQVGGTAQSAGTMTVRNNADSEVDYYLWPGLTTSQKGSFTYKDWNGNSQWYLVKDAANNWALNSAVGGLDSFKAYQSTNSGDTYIDASNSTGHIRMNYETGAGAETDIYSGSSSSLAASFLGPTSIKLPGLAATSGHYCLQIDNSGYITNTGSACGSGSGTSGTVNSGNAGAIAYYSASGTAVAGETTIPVTAGGTGAATAAAAVSNLLPGVGADGNNGITISGTVAAGNATAKTVGGIEYASQYQSGNGNNGIANASLGATNETVIADPSYGITEQPTQNSFAASPFHFQDLRLGVQVDFYHNPLFGRGVYSPWFGANDSPGHITNCLFDQPQTYATGSGQVDQYQGCEDTFLTSTVPGFSIGNTSTGGATGWAVQAARRYNTQYNTSGIGETILANQVKTGAGDNAAVYGRVSGWGNAPSDSDEGVKAFAGDTVEDAYDYIGECKDVAGGPECTSGATLIKTDGSWDVGQQGTYQYLIDTTRGASPNTMTAIGAGLNGKLSAVTVATPVTASTAWGTLVANVPTPVNTTSPYTTSETFTINVVSGTFNTTGLMCFASHQHDVTIPTTYSLSGGVATITAPLVTSEYAGDYVFQGGPCGEGLEATYYTHNVAANFPLRYLMDVVGATSTTVLQTTVFAVGVAHKIPLSSNVLLNTTITSASNNAISAATYTSGGSISGTTGQTCTLSSFNNSSTATATVALTGSNTIAGGTALVLTNPGLNATAAPTSATLGSGTATCSGTATISTTISATLVTFNFTGNGLYQFPGVSLTFSGTTGSALNGVCTGSKFYANTLGTCSITGLSGLQTSTAGTAVFTGASAINLWPMSMVLDVQNETVSPPVVDGTFLIQPNNINFNPNDNIEELHGITGIWNNMTEYLAVDNPFPTVIFGHQVTVVGNGAVGGSTSTSSNAMLSLQNEQSDGYYVEGGGTANPLNVRNMEGAYYIADDYAEGPSPGAALTYVTHTSTQLADPTYFYNIFKLYDNSGITSWNYFPYTGNMTFYTPGTAAWYAIGGHQFYGSETHNGTASFNAGVTTTSLQGTTSVQIGSGTAMTGNHGTAVYAQHSDGTGTPGNLAKFASDGSVTSGPVPSVTVNGVTCTLGSTCSPASASPSVITTPGDTICAVAGDTTVGAQAITGVASTVSTMTYTLSAPAPTFLYAGQLISSQGNTTAGYNAAPLTVAAVSGSTVTVSSSNNPGSGTGGGTLSLYCSNQSTDAVGSNQNNATYFATHYQVSANYFTAGSHLQMTEQMLVFANDGGATYANAGSGYAMEYGSFQGVWSTFNKIVGSIIANASNGAGGTFVQDITALTTTNLMFGTTAFSYPTTVASPLTSTANGINSVSSSTTSNANYLNFGLWYAPTGVVSGTYTSGGTVTGTVGQTCTLTSFNNSSTATATVTLTGTNTIAGGTALVITSRGTNASAAPTSATLGSGTATCSGTATIATVVGGSPGYATTLVDLIVRP